MSKVTLHEGETIYVQGTGKKPYEVKMTGGVISCSCPAWRNQSAKIDQRTCKHIKANVENATVVPVAIVPTTEIGSEDAPRKQAVVKETAPEVLLAHPWDGEQDLVGWWISEKLDGVRAYWDGTKFITRLGNTYNAPAWFTANFPKTPLDGELWAGRKKFQKCLGAVRKMIPIDDEWKQITYMVFDLPTSDKPFEDRKEELRNIVKGCDNITVVEQKKCHNMKHLKETLEAVQALGGEGLVVRQPGSLYESGRSHTALKIKTYFDVEVTVIGHQKGKGRHKGRMGALECRFDNGVEFEVGTGFSDKERENPPAIGSRITIHYTELTEEGRPKCAGFIAVRDYE